MGHGNGVIDFISCTTCLCRTPTRLEKWVTFIFLLFKKIRLRLYAVVYDRGGGAYFCI